MRKLDKLIYQAAIPPLFISLVVLTFVVFVNQLGNFSELLITRNAAPEAILIIAAAIAPRILIFTLPFAFLIGILIGLSGLSGEYQITALRACGVPLRRLLQPILAIAVVVGFATGAMSVVILPATNDILRNLTNLISLRQATTQIVPRVFNEDFPNVVFYLDDLSIDRQRWERVFLADNSNPEAPRIVMAREGSWISDAGGVRMQLHLNHGTIYEVNPQEPQKDNISVFAATDIPIDVNRAQMSSPHGDAREPAEMATWDLWHGSSGAAPNRRLEERIELHRRFALPFSVLGFALVGLSLGICTRRGGRTSGSVLALLLVILYHVLFMNGFRLARVGQLPPWLGLWGADLILLAIGIGLLANAEQNNWLTQCLTNWRWKPRIEIFVQRLHLSSIRSALRKMDDIAISSTGRIARLRFPKVLDSYISRGFIVYFFWSTLVCYSLFVILTLFDLLDEIITNNSAASLVIRYFVFLSPQILLLIVPMSVLLAVLIQFGILEKNSEVTALKAGGWSLYRIALPVFMVSAFFSAGIYFMQDYILPYANVQQDALRNLIKGRPPQTSRVRKWILGAEGHIYNYDWYDSGKDLFVGLNVYDVDLQQLAIRRRYYAQRARIDSQGHWILEDGWRRDFLTANGFAPISKEIFQFPEKADYFKRDILQPGESSKLTYLELNNYINYLKQSGYNATELQVELNKKISFPLSCFIMALLGVPFSFSMGKKGAFFGITASVTIAMIYWGVVSIFEQMGAYGMLAPFLSAWAPNLLFGAAGLALLFTIRT